MMGRLRAWLAGTRAPADLAAEALARVPREMALALYPSPLVPAAVLVGLVPAGTGWEVLLTRRTDHLRDHPGQISFPGGRLEAADEDTVRTRSYSGKPMRVKKNPYVEEWETRPQDIQAFPMQAMVSHQAGVMGGIGGQIEGLDPDRSCFAMGQSAGGVHEVLPAATIVANLIKEAEAAIDRTAKLRAGVPA